MKGKDEKKEKNINTEWVCEQTIQEDFSSLAKEEIELEKSSEDKGKVAHYAYEQTIQEDFSSLAQEAEPAKIQKNNTGHCVYENTVNEDFPLSSKKNAENIDSPQEIIIPKKTSFDPQNLEKIYKIQKEIARGGMGVIHKIWDQDLQRDLAMKVWQPQANENEACATFLAEARITAQLEHPNIIPVHDIGLMHDKKIYFTMKLISGEDVSCIIRKIFLKEQEYLEKYTLHALLTIFRKVCDAVAFAHSRNIVHRDIKPQNIMVGKHGEVLLMDWGIAKIFGQQEKQGKIMGTPHYMSPEQSRGDNKAVDKRSDIYLLGATLYHMLTLYPPHKGSNILKTLYFIQKGIIDPPHERNRSKQIPMELSRIVMKCLSLKQEDRYQTVEALCEDIDNLMSGTISSKPVTFKKGDFLMRQGEEGNNAYSILSGSAEIFQNISGRSVLLATLETGSVVGEMGLISSAKRSADVVAKEDMEVLVIDKKLLKEALDRMPPWMEKIVSTLVSRLQTANNNVHPLKIGDPVYYILNHLGIMVSFLAAKASITQIEEYEISFDTIAKEISITLCISEEKVKSVLSILLETNLCERTEENKFHFKDFLLFCHVLMFLRNTLEIEISVDWIGKLPALDQEKNIRRCQIAAQLSKEVKEFLLNIPIYAKYIKN